MSGLKDVDLLEGAEEELAAAGSPQERNWRGVAIALIVIFVMCSIISIAVLILTPLNANADAPRLRVTLNDAVGPIFLSPVESLEWIDSQRIVVKKTDTFEMIDLSSETPTDTTKILDSEELSRYDKVSSVTVSPKERYIAVLYSATKKSPKSVYRIFDRNTSTFENVGPLNKGDENVKVLTWNPVGNDFAYVHNNNVYYKQHPSAKDSIKITSTGSYDLLNGVADWLYEEEILQTQQALWWSKSGNYLAFLTIDNRDVTHVNIPLYGQRQYPINVEQAYPKTGSTNLPIASISIWNKLDANIKNIKNLSLDKIDSSLTTYLFSASWIQLYGRDVLVAVWANRYQNTTAISLCTYESGECVSNLIQTYTVENNKLWAEPEDSKIKFYTNDAYFTLLPHHRSNSNVYTQIARVNVKEDLSIGRETFLAVGEYDIDGIEAFDATNNLIIVLFLAYGSKRIFSYFTAAAPNPTQRHLYVTSAVTVTGGPQEAQCITCKISPNCTFHETTFAPNNASISSESQHLYLNCKGPGTPHIVFGRLENGTKFVQVVEYGRNKFLENALTTHRFPSVKFDNVVLNNGYVAYCKILLPHDLSLKQFTKRYPVLVNVYAGPGTQKVTEEWLSSFVDIYFASEKEYIVISIDGRGTGYRGWRQKQPLYGNFGTVEVDDQITAIRELLKRYPFMDPSRVGVWGWSYGGFVSARIVQRDNNSTFKCSASVAPVTNFKYYDATYTERYMGAADSEAYARTDLTRNVTAFYRTRYMLAHGTGDDNVHFQNTAEFARTLTENNVQFQLMIYADDSHNLFSNRWHLYNMLTNFFTTCFA